MAIRRIKMQVERMPKKTLAQHTDSMQGTRVAVSHCLSASSMKNFRRPGVAYEVRAGGK